MDNANADIKGPLKLKLKSVSPKSKKQSIGTEANLEAVPIDENNSLLDTVFLSKEFDGAQFLSVQPDSYLGTIRDMANSGQLDITKLNPIVMQTLQPYTDQSYATLPQQI